MAISSNYIVEYLLQYQELSLEKIGTFHLVQNAEEPTASVSFTCNKKVESSPEFIHFLSEKMNKPIVLVAQDLISYLDQARQLVNLHNPFIIEGLGYIHLDNEGKYVLNATANAVEVIKESEKQTTTDIYAKNPVAASANDYERRRNSKQLWWWALAAVIIAALAYGAYYIHSNFANNQTANGTEEQPSATVVPPKPNVDTAQNNAPLAAKTKDFKFIIQTFVESQNCDERQAQLKSYNENVGRDSIMLDGKPLYRLFIVDDTLKSAADTTAIKERLEAYYGHTVTIE